MVTDVEKVIRQYLPNIIHMSLATSRENKPWICEVHYAFDNMLNLYFRSTPARRHSADIALNPFVAGNMVTQHIQGEKPRGVYFEGKAEMLKDIDENHQAFLMLSQRFGSTSAILEEAKMENGHKFYKISVDTFYLFDVKESSPSQKYTLAWNK